MLYIQFALRVHYATEGHPVWMDTKRWRRIMAQDCAGVADTIYRAERMRSFVIPADLVPAGSIMWRRIFNYGTQEGPIVSEAPLAPLVGELELEDEEDEVREGDEPELDAEPPALGEAPGDETEYEAEWEDEDDAGTLDGGDEDEGTEADVEPRDVQFSPAPEEEYQPQPANLYGPDTQSEGASGLSEAESETEYEVLDSMRPRRTEDALPDDDASAESEEHEEHDDSIVLLPSDDEHAPRGPPRPSECYIGLKIRLLAYICCHRSSTSKNQKGTCNFFRPASNDERRRRIGRRGPHNGPLGLQPSDAHRCAGPGSALDSC